MTFFFLVVNLKFNFRNKYFALWHYFLVVNPRFNLGFNQGINVRIIGLTFHLVLRIRAQTMMAQISIRFLLTSWIVQIVSDMDFAAVHQIDRGFEGEVKLLPRLLQARPSSWWNSWKSESSTSFSRPLTRSTSCLQWTRRIRSFLVIICLRCKVCFPCNLCTAADLSPHQPLGTSRCWRTGTTHAWYLYSTAVQYSTVQYLPLYFFLVTGPRALPSPSF